MAQTVNRQVNIYIASGEAEKALDRLTAKQKSFKDQLAKTTDPKETSRLEKELKKLEEPIDRAAKKLRSELSPSMRDLQKTISTLQNQLKQTGIGDAEFNRLTVAIRKARIEMAEAQQKMDAINKTASKGSVVSRVGSKLDNFSQSTFGVGIGAAGGALAAGAFLKTAIEEALDAEQTASRLKATLDNLGKSDAFERLGKAAEEMAQKFSFIDNDEILGVFQQLLQYGKLTEKEMQDLTPVIIDFAGQQRISLEESADVIIKALEGNGKALKTYGIDIKDASTTTERLGLIMTTLKGKVDGAAEAFGETTQGRLKETKQKFFDIAENVGTKLLPVLNKLMQAVQFVLLGIEGLVNVVGDAINFVFDHAQFKADQLAGKLRDIQALAAAEGAKLFEQYKNKSTELLEKDLQRQQVALSNAKKLYDRAVKEKNDADIEYYAERVAKEQALTDAIKGELDGRKIVEERDRKDREEKDKEARDKARAAAEKAAKELAALLEDIRKKTSELNFYNSNALEKDLIRMNEYYDGLEKRANGNVKVLAEIADLRGREETLIIQKYRKQWEEEEKAAAKKRSDEQLRLDQQRLAKQYEYAAQLAKEAAESSAKSLNNLQAQKELAVITSRGKARLKAIKDQLNLEEQLALKAVEGQEDQKALIQEQYRQKRADADLDHFKQQFDQYVQVAQAVAGLLSDAFSLQAERENAELEADRRNNERKKENFKRQLDAKILSQDEYDKKVQDLERKQEAREKQIKIRQFQRDKALAITNAIINTASAIVKALPDPFLVALTAAVGAVQVGLIAAQKTPQFARGGYLPGPRHTEGGMPVINPRTGAKVAEVEGGEVILSRNTVRNNASIVDQLLQSSMFRNGAPINPAWRHASPSYLNLPVINQGMQTVRRFEKGGIMPSGTAGSSIDAEVLSDLAASVRSLNQQLAGGIQAYTLLSDNERQQARINAIRQDATFK